MGELLSLGINLREGTEKASTGGHSCVAKAFAMFEAKHKWVGTRQGCEEPKPLLENTLYVLLLCFQN